METTRKFERLPPLAGVHFAGFQDVKIESRQSVVRQLRDFIRYCLKEATAPAVQVILGEWGEGKTEAYQRYIRPEIKVPNHAYLVSASTVANSLPKVQAESPLASLNFLAAVFYAIQHEAKTDLVAPPERFINTEQWLEATFRAHAKGKILVFIDEFEELILDPPALRAILSGLKELINKQYRLVTEDGKYPGIISFFLSCTPDAYARMQRDPEIAEVFGSWERRTSKIQLVGVTKREGVKFLCDLMRYAYNDQLPVPLPIRDLGVFYTLQVIGRGNLGALVTLFAKVFNSATIDDQTMHVIDGTKLLNFLAGETISVYGGTAKCIEHHLLESLTEGLSEQEASLFSLLVGELRPFSIPDLMERLSIPSETDVSALITRINQKMTGKANVAIASFAPLREGLTFQDVQKALQAETRENEIQVDGFTQRLDELEDDLTFLELHEGQLVSQIFFPWDHRMIGAAFEGITPDSAHRLEKRVEKIVDPNRLHYRLSSELVFQFFPTPISVGLEFIKDRNLRLKMWRDVTARFPQLFRDDMIRAFLSLIQYVETFDIEADDLRVLRYGFAAIMKDSAQNATIRCYCYAHYGDLGAGAVRQIEEGSREAANAHLVLLIHVGEVTQEGQEEIRAREMENYLLPIPLHTNLAKRILVTFQSKTLHPQNVDDRLFVDCVTRLFKSEIELSRRIKEWLERGVGAGIVLRDLYKATAKGERDLADSLKFYINRLGDPDTPENIFQANQRLMGFVPFGRQVGFIPDIESAARLRKYTEDLAKNGFVRCDIDGIVHVTHTPPEKRLLRILEKTEPVAKSDVGSHFINCAQARNILEEVYLNVLKHKGMIEESKGLLYRLGREKALQQARSVRTRYYDLLAPREEQEEWPAFAHIFVTKQRDSRFIAIPELKAYLDELYEGVQEAAQQDREEVVLQRTALLTHLAEHLQDTLMPKVNSAISEALRISENILNRIDSILEDIEDAVNQYNRWLKQNITPGDVKEARDLSESKDRIRLICTTRITATDLSRAEKEDDAFAHQGWTKQEQLFNVALRRLQKSTELLQRQVENNEKVLHNVRRALEALEGVGVDIRSRLLTLQVPEEYKLSKIVHTRLSEFLRTMSAADSALIPESTDAMAPAFTLSKMLEDLQELHRPLDDRYRKADRATTELEELVQTERKFHQVIRSCSAVLGTWAQKADIEPFRADVQELGRKLAKIREAYDSQSSRLEGSDVEETIEFMKIRQLREATAQLVKDIEEVTAELERIWERYVKECEHFADSIFELVRLAKRQNAHLHTKAVEARSRQLLEAIQDQEGPGRPMSDYEAEKIEIRKAILDLLRDTLDEAEGNVLMAVIERRDQSRSGWFSLTQIVHAIADEADMSGSELEELIRSLVRKGYLVEGVAIPV